jgi:hypothetical protein
MPSTRIDLDAAPWTPGSPFYGPDSIYHGRELFELKILSDRRAQGGGIAWLLKSMPPQGKLIKIVAVALSDEHVVPLEGGRTTKSGATIRAAGGYTLNPKGQPHSAFIGQESLTLVIYSGEPDEITAIEVVDAASAAE